MNPTRRNLLASSGMLVSVVALGGVSPVAEEATPRPKTKTGGASETDTTRDPFAQLAYQRAQQDRSIDYIDIRDYGTVTQNGDIAPALQAALNAFPTHRNPRIRIPAYASDGTAAGTYTCSPVTWHPGRAFIIEFDCHQITLTGANQGWIFPGGYTIRGMRTANLGQFYPYAPLPRPFISGGGGATNNATTPTALITLTGTNIRIENLWLGCGGGPALFLHGCELVTVSQMVIGSGHPTQPAFKSDSVFWCQMDNILAEPGVGNTTFRPFAMEFTTDTNFGKNNGLFTCRNFIIGRNGMLFRSRFGPGGVNNFDLYELHSENQFDGTALLTFDLTNSLVGYMKFEDIGISDAGGFAGGASAWHIRNIGGNTDGIQITNSNADILFAPGSTPIRNFVLDNSVTSNTSPFRFDPALNKTYGLTSQWASWSHKTASSIDTKLMTAPVGVPWLIGTPFNVQQDPANWTPVNDPSGSSTPSLGVVTTGLPGPDGSLKAGRVSGGGGARCFGPSNFTIAAGDWFIWGAWMRDPSGKGVQHLGTVFTRFDIIGGSGTRFSGSSAGGNLAGNNNADYIPDNGWVWCCGICKINSLGNGINPGSIRFDLCPEGTPKEIFMPCALRIPAGSGYDDAWVVNFARSLKGGWSSTGVSGDITFPDHQPLKAGIFKATAKTFATLPASPVAGMQAFITDCNTATWGATAAGGGSSKVMVWYNGTNWTVMGK